MPARRTPRGLKLAHNPSSAATANETDARVGGKGLDFDEIPAVLDEGGRTEWQRIGEVYADQPTRFREGDRAALVAYCSFWSAFHAAAADVAERGPVVVGRSTQDRNRAVKNPSTVAMREASSQLRYWARELGLTPDARVRIGVSDQPEEQDDANNPFAG